MNQIKHKVCLPYKNIQMLSITVPNLNYIITQWDKTNTMPLPKNQRKYNMTLNKTQNTIRWKIEETFK